MTKLLRTLRGACALSVVALLAASEAGVAHGLQEPGGVESAIDARLREIRADIIALHRDIHMHPETSGNEERTAGVIADRMRRLGLEVRTGVGGHGVVALLRGKTPGPVVAFRADMDAVQTNTHDPAEYRSLTPGVRHHCGHDLHTTIGVALAEALATVRLDIAGTVMFVFQPAEESATGAGAMLQDDMFRDARPAAMFAYHTAPMQVGQFATSLGALLPGRDRVVVTLRGTGAEAAAAEARQLVRSVATVGPDDALAATTDDFISVNVGRPIPRNGTYVVNATLTTASVEASAAAEGQIREGLERLSSDAVSATLAYEEDWVAGVTNDPDLASFAIQRLETAPGVEGVTMVETMSPMFSEDFGRLQSVIPGVMFYLGTSNAEKEWVGMPHSPDFVADEEAIFVGARAMGAVLLHFLQRR